MKRFPITLKAACGAFGISLLVGCTGTLGNTSSSSGSSGNPNSGSTNGGGTASGTGTSTGTGTGAGSNNASMGAGASTTVGAGTGQGTTTGNTGTSGTGTGTGSGAGTGVGTGTGTGTTVVADPTSAGLRPLRLLTGREYLNTVRDLLQDTSLTADALPPEDEDPASSFAFHSTGTVSDQVALLYQSAAETIATNAVAKMSTLLPCAAGANNAAAEQTCLTPFVTKLYRRPLAAADTARMTDIVAAGKALGLNFSAAVGFLIEEVLQSPEFLYHWEIDPTPAVREGSVVKLGSYELANRLAYGLWGTIPDDTLFAAAAANQLGDATSVETQVRRMLKDPKAASTIQDFFSDWLDADLLPERPKDAGVYPMYNDMLTSAMATEIQTFAKNIVISGTGKLDELMTSVNTVANQYTAALYGVSGVSGATMKSVMLDPNQRSGLLTSGAFLALTGGSAGSHPPRRGKAVYYKFLCGELPPVPAVIPTPAPATSGGTTRQRFSILTNQACAQGCHSILDPLGDTFENYDGIGQYRSMDNGLPVDASALVTIDGQAQMVNDARGLAALLAASDQGQACFTRQWFRYALGRMDTDQDLASINTASATFKAMNHDVRELLVSMTTSRTFRYRTPGTSEALQ